MRKGGQDAMRRRYEAPIAVKLEFDYPNTVVASGPLNLLGTSDQQWCHSSTPVKTDTVDDVANTCGGSDSRI